MRMQTVGVQMSLYIGLLETQGNQGYVYATNRERAARGASELLQISTTTWVREAISEMESGPMTLSERSIWISGSENNQWQGDIHTDSVTVVVATSGRAVLLCSNAQRLATIISKVSEKALRRAPGLSVIGAIEEIDESETDCFGAAQRRASQRLGVNLSRLTSSQHRLAQLPIVATCGISGLPVEEIRLEGGHPTPISGLVNAQLNWAAKSWKRFQESVGSEKIAENVDQIPTAKSWRAVVHADGNGVGKVFVELSQKLWKQGDSYAANFSRWIFGYREFSLALEMATEAAFIEATLKVGAERVFPILLGGDDITVEISADCARDFTITYLKAFEHYSTSAINVLKKHGIAESELPDTFTAGAGIAIVKAHFPFHVAYDLAVDLIESAKSAKNGEGDAKVSLSTFDVHVLYDSTFSGLGNVREKLISRDDRQLWGGPYVVGDSESSFASEDQLEELCSAILKMGRSRQVHAIAHALPMGASETQRTIENATATNQDQNLSGWKDLILDNRNQETKRSLLIDAIHLLDVEGASL